MLSRAGLMEIFPGFAITLIIAVISFLSSSLHPSFDALVISIIFGMLVSNLIGDKHMLEKGVNAALGVFLPIGIGLYGAQLTFTHTQSMLWPGILAMFLVIFLVTYLVSRGFGISRNLALLLCTGMSVCGASAIAVIAPLLGCRKEETSISIISVMTVGLTGMLIYRFMPDIIGFSVVDFSFLTGMTLPMFGQVQVAAATMGPESLLLATKIKLTRISALAIVALLAVIFSRKERSRFYVPWFMLIFFALAFATNMFPSFAPIGAVLKPISKFSLVTALSSIGMSLDFDSITEAGTAPLFAVFLSWGIVVLTVYLVLSVMG